MTSGHERTPSAGPRVRLPVEGVPQFLAAWGASGWYRRELAWTTGQSEFTVWVQAWHDREALCVAEEFGERVLAVLPRLTPIVQAPGPPGEWQFWCRPRAMGEALPDGLDEHPDVRYVWGNSILFLPPSRLSKQPLLWLTAPSTPLIPFTLLCTAIATALSSGTT